MLLSRDNLGANRLGGHAPWRQRTRALTLPAIIVALILAVGVVTIANFVTDRYSDARHDRDTAAIARGSQFQQALLDAGYGVRSYLLSGQVADLLPYQLARQRLTDLAPTLLPQLDGHRPGQTAAAAALDVLLKAWTAAIAVEETNQHPVGASSLFAPQVEAAHDQLQREVADYIAHLTDRADRWNYADDVISLLFQIVMLTAVITAASAMIYAFGRITRAISTGFAAQEQTEQLFAMADMLQSAAGQDDTNDVLRATAVKLLPDFGGALYVFNNSRDRLDLSTHWGPQFESNAGFLLPTACWALKRGKPHLNSGATGALRCTHAEGQQVTLEIPMAARGEVYGLLEISVDPGLPDGPARLRSIQPIAAAMADAMSLALSSLALRETLRNQALRDSLTGLYNRRFLEEMLERMCLDAERRRAPISAIMIDLDHFKRLNDQFGHGAGDAVLRDVASAILSCLRGTDVACRYGGEELAVLLPDCNAAMACGRAEQIRARVSELTQVGGVKVSASFGVSCIPETCVKVAELLPTADAALYRAKQLGRDRVECAAPRATPPRLSIIDPTHAEPDDGVRKPI
jgi:diguanylate cyclase (GGDEF)-like protein